jgi:putative oxidoreductase
MADFALVAVAALWTSTSPVPETRELVRCRVGLTWLCCVFEGLPGMTGLDDLVWYGARVCLVAMFPFSAVDKVWHWKNSLAQTASRRLPGAKPMLILAIAVEFITPICIVAGIYDRIAAFLLAGFCVVTAFLYHPFWAYPDFWIQSDSSQAREHFWQFLKNFGLVGGLLLVVFAGDLAPTEVVLRSPFTSSRDVATGVP